MVIKQCTYIDAPCNVSETKRAMAIKNTRPHGATWNGLLENNSIRRDRLCRIHVLYYRWLELVGLMSRLRREGMKRWNNHAGQREFAGLYTFKCHQFVSDSRELVGRSLHEKNFHPLIVLHFDWNR